MARKLSNKRTAVAQRYSQRIKALAKKGFDIDKIKSKLDKIEGISVSSKNNIKISDEAYNKNQSKILASLEKIVKTASKADKQRKNKLERFRKKYENAIAKRIAKLADTFEMSKEEFLDRVNESVEGVMTTNDGNIVIEPDKFNEDTRAALKSAVGSEKSMLKEAKETLMDEGLSEGDIAALGKQGLIKKARNIMIFQSDSSIFKKFYEIYSKENKGTVLPQYSKSSRTNVDVFDNLYDSMVEIGHIVHDQGFKGDYWSQKKEVEKIINKVKSL